MVLTELTIKNLKPTGKKTNTLRSRYKLAIIKDFCIDNFA